MSEGKSLDVGFVKEELWSAHALFPSGSARTDERLHGLIRLQQGSFVISIEFSVGKCLKFVNILSFTHFSKIHRTGELPLNSGYFIQFVLVLSDLIVVSQRLEVLAIFWRSILTRLFPLVRVKRMLFVANIGHVILRVVLNLLS